jgi:hypothetical protein
MRKYAGLSLALAMCISIVMAYGFARTARGDSLNNSRDNGDIMMRNLDSSLAAKIKDYLEIIAEIQKIGDEKSSPPPAEHANLLSGGKAPPHFKHTTRHVKAPANMPPEKPWWSDYELNMVAYSDKSRTAVVNGKFVREGDSVRNGVTVSKIDSQSVTLDHKGTSNGSAQEQPDETKILFVKPR